MSTDFLYLGPVPCDEPCAQVGEMNYQKNSSIEMSTYIDQLYRMFPELENSSLAIRKKWFPHDFGSYGEVIAVYNEEDEQAYDLALKIERNLPYKWDKESLKYLKENLVK
jgi:hypothetical protein